MLALRTAFSFISSKLLSICSLALLSVIGLGQPALAIDYVYDELGRLRAVIDPASDTAVYEYDAVENLLSISRQVSTAVSIIEFGPKSGPIGTTVTIHGTGFGATAGENTVSFNGAPASITSATTTQIVASVPAGATTGPISVTTSTGSAASSTNFLVTSGASQGAPTITGFNPTIGTPGTSVTITGTNFLSTAINDNVTIGSKHAAIASATTTTITTTVPTGTPSGPISVGTPFGRATTTADFFIPPPPFTAANVVFTDRMTIGNSKTITVNTANKIGLVIFDAVAGQRVSLLASNNSMTGNTVIKLLRPDWATVTFGTLPFFTFLDVQALPLSGVYTLLVDPDGTATGSVTITIYNVPPDVTVPITPGGSAVTVTTTTPGQNAKATFSGNAGQKVSLGMSNITIPPSSNVSILKPDGSTLASKTNVANGVNTFIDAVTLPVSGNYTILVNPQVAVTGSMTLTLHNVTDIAGTITPGGAPVTVTITTPGQNASATFTGNAGQRVSHLASKNTMTGNTLIKIVKPDGTNLTFGTLPFSTFLDVQTLPVSGTYTVAVDPEGTATGSVTLTLYDVPTDFSGTITVGGSAVSVTTTTPGQNATLTFNGTSGQQATVRVTGNAICAVTVKLLKPDGSQLTTFGPSCGATFNLSTQTLPTTGTYTVKIDPADNATGSLTVSVTSP